MIADIPTSEREVLARRVILNYETLLRLQEIVANAVEEMIKMGGFDQRANKLSCDLEQLGAVLQKEREHLGDLREYFGLKKD